MCVNTHTHFNFPSTQIHDPTAFTFHAPLSESDGAPVTPASLDPRLTPSMGTSGRPGDEGGEGEDGEEPKPLKWDEVDTPPPLYGVFPPAAYQAFLSFPPNTPMASTPVGVAMPRPVPPVQGATSYFPPYPPATPVDPFAAQVVPPTARPAVWAGSGTPATPRGVVFPAQAPVQMQSPASVPVPGLALPDGSASATSTLARLHSLQLQALQAQQVALLQLQMQAQSASEAAAAAIAAHRSALEVAQRANGGTGADAGLVVAMDTTGSSGSGSWSGSSGSGGGRERVAGQAHVVGRTPVPVVRMPVPGPAGSGGQMLVGLGPAAPFRSNQGAMDLMLAEPRGGGLLGAGIAGMAAEGDGDGDGVLDVGGMDVGDDGMTVQEQEQDSWLEDV
ncbi:hypothetical protein M427DRAFT_473127 [Gonapodya prolifera JEL478]|uniref:Uncharacterized protein n=1 Tax=Gonapodya prolifera (strain JEL478) TaxID=1344416 RepID=A0A139AS30_GONPJ|nr:hypothetical protein M427DRAFT_473127 [Gonapodya prolifera JEL478]|eukprot:KXS19275.1 hypothetical protein M427DRAFT_473127 [Gonapodya prolifera JEL478]